MADLIRRSENFKHVFFSKTQHSERMSVLHSPDNVYTSRKMLLLRAWTKGIWGHLWLWQLLADRLFHSVSVSVQEAMDWRIDHSNHHKQVSSIPFYLPLSLPIFLYLCLDSYSLQKHSIIKLLGEKIVHTNSIQSWLALHQDSLYISSVYLSSCCSLPVDLQIPHALLLALRQINLCHCCDPFSQSTIYIVHAIEHQSELFTVH